MICRSVSKSVSRKVSQTNTEVTPKTDIVSNGDFSNGSDSWTPSIGADFTVTGGVATIMSDEGGFDSIEQIVPTQEGTEYTGFCDFEFVTGNGKIRLSGDDTEILRIDNLEGSSRESFSFEATSEQTRFQFFVDTPSSEVKIYMVSITTVS